MSALIRGTENEKGLRVKAFLVEQVFEKGIKVAEEIFQAIHIQPHEICPRWNYTICPNMACT
jgi:hypothetical protein